MNINDLDRFSNTDLTDFEKRIKTPKVKDEIKDVYNLYELKLVTGDVLMDTLILDAESNYYNDILYVKGDKVVYSKLLKDSIRVDLY